MTFDHALLGYQARPNDLYKIALWLGAVVFVIMGLAMIAWNVDISSMFIVLCIPTAIINIVWLKIFRPITGAAFNKLELLLLSVILFIAWVIAAALWLNALESVIIALLLLCLIAIICLLPEYAGTELSPEMDERVKRIDVNARAGAYYVAFFTLVILSTLALLKILDLGTYNSLLVTWLVIGYSWFVLKWYYGRKGDVA